MQRLGLMVLSLMTTFAALAANEFGDYAVARAAHPDFFRPGIVTIATLDGEDWYVYCGESEKFFDEELDSELYEEAVVQAKVYFFNYFAKDDPGVKVSASGARKMYQFADGSFRCVVMGVKRGNVKVTPGKVIMPTAKIDPSKPTLSKVDPPEVEPIKVGVEKSAAMKVAPTKVDVINPVKVDSPKVAEMSPDAKIAILQTRLEKNPDDFHTRIRIARLYVQQNQPGSALKYYSAAAHQIISRHDKQLPDDETSELLEAARYEESQGEFGLALKHYRAVLRAGDAEATRQANSRISDLLLK